MPHAIETSIGVQDVFLLGGPTCVIFCGLDLCLDFCFNCTSVTHKRSILIMITLFSFIISRKIQDCAVTVLQTHRALYKTQFKNRVTIKKGQYEHEWIRKSCIYDIAPNDIPDYMLIHFRSIPPWSWKKLWELWNLSTIGRWCFTSITE